MKKIIITVGLVLLPAVTFAQATQPGGRDIQNIAQLLNNLRQIMNLLGPLLVGLAVLAFMWGTIQYIWGKSADKIKEARSYMIFSIIAISVMLSVYSLAYFLKNSFFPTQRATIDVYNNQDVSGTNPWNGTLTGGTGPGSFHPASSLPDPAAGSASSQPPVEFYPYPGY